jgi:predicted phage tail protein
MKVVKVHGALKERLGEGTFHFNVDTPAQAIKALCVNFEGLEKWIIDSEQDGIGYKVLIGKEEVTRDSLEMLELPWSEKDVFSITPVLTGAGRGTWNFLLGAALIFTGGLMAAGTFGSWAAGAKIGTFGGSAMAVSSVVKTAGVMLALGGISEMLTPLPQMPRDPSRNESFGFGGVINTTGQGTPVPIAYGRLFIGSAPISVGLDVDQVEV